VQGQHGNQSSKPDLLNSARSNLDGGPRINAA
jgi:hypothetical protein